MSTFNNGFIQSGDGNLNEPVHVGRPGQQVVFSSINPSESYLAKYPTIESVPADFNGTVDIVTPTYRATVKGDGTTKYTTGVGAVSDRPTAADFGVGTWQDGGITYNSNGVGWGNTTATATNMQLVDFRAAVAKTQAGLSNTTILEIGDSTTRGSGAATLDAGARQLAPTDVLARRLIDAGISANVSSQIGGSGVTLVADLANYNPTVSVGAGWSFQAVASISQRLTNSTTVNPIDFTPLDAAGAPLVFDTIEVYYIQYVSYARLTIGVDGGAAAFTSTPANGPIVEKATATVALGTHTVNIAKHAADAAKIMTVIGWVCYDSTKKQVLCLNAGIAGKAIGTMGSNPGYTTAFSEIEIIQPHLSIINCCINDSGALTNTSTYRSLLQGLITKCLLYGSVILRPGNPVQPRDMEPYLSINRELASANNIPIIDLSDMYGDYNTYNDLGMMYDLLHPNNIGYQDIGNIVAKAITP